MIERIEIAAIIAITLICITFMVCDTIDRATAAPKVIKFAFEKAGAIGFQPNGGEK